MGADYVDDPVFLADTRVQAESLLYSLKQAARRYTSIYIDKAEFMSFKQNEASLN